MCYRFCQRVSIPHALLAGGGGLLLTLAVGTAQGTSISDPTTPSTPVFDTEPPLFNPVLADPSALSTTVTPIVTPTLETDIVSAGVVIDDSLEPAPPAPIITTTSNPTGAVGPLAPGSHTLTWTVTDQGFNTDTNVQNIAVMPVVNFAADQTVGLTGATVNARVTVMLSGQLPGAPVDVSFNITPSAGVTYTLVPGLITITPPATSGSMTIEITGVAGTGTITLDSMGITPVGLAEAGNKTTHVISIDTNNHAPIANITAAQFGSSNTTHFIFNNSNEVTLTANAYDANGNNVTYDWSATDNSLIPTNGTVNPTFKFNPGGLAPGFYTARVTVTDDDLIPASSSAEILLQIIDPTTITLSGTVDTDDDKTSDNVDGSADSAPNDGIPDYIDDKDFDGIPDYLDAIEYNDYWLPGTEFFVFDIPLKQSDKYTEGNLTIEWSLQDAASNIIYYPLLIATEPGLKLSVGPTARRAGSYYGRLNTADMENIRGISVFIDSNFKEYSGDGQVIDVKISGLKTPGQSVNLVIPQTAPLPPSDPAYLSYPKFKVYGKSKSWIEFDETISTTGKTNNYCPPPTDVSYAAGPLAVGDECIQLTITDGGNNDYDGKANGTVQFMGAPMIMATTTPTPGKNTAPSFSGSLDGSEQSLNKNDAGSGGGGYIGLLMLFGLSIFLVGQVVIREINES